MMTSAKNEILPFARTWMDLDGIMLSKISRRENKHGMLWENKHGMLWENKHGMLSLRVASKKLNTTTTKNKNKTDSQIKEQTSGYQQGETGWRAK